MMNTQSIALQTQLVFFEAHSSAQKWWSLWGQVYWDFRVWYLLLH